MRVGLFTDADAFAGTERHMLELARGLRKQGLEPAIICPGHGALAKAARSEEIPVLAMPKRGKFDWRAIRSLAGMFRGRNIDLVHVHNGRTSMIAAIAVSLAGRGKVVATQHFIAPTRLGRRGVKGVASKLAHRWVEQRIGRYIAISNAVRDGMLNRHDTTPDKIVVVPNGISSPVLDGTLNPADLRKELGVPPGGVLIACAARLEAEKDVRSLVEAMPIVAAKHPQALCVIAGDGSQRAHLEGRMRRLGLERNVRLLGFRTDVPAILRAADIFVLPCPVEGFGLALVEAMAVAKPVIATAAGGPLEIVADGQTGLLVPPSNPVALGQAIIRLIADESLRVQMGLSGYTRFTERFTADRMAAQTAAVYRQVLFAEPGLAEEASVPETSNRPFEAASNANG